MGALTDGSEEANDAPVEAAASENESKYEGMGNSTRPPDDQAPTPQPDARVIGETDPPFALPPAMRRRLAMAVTVMILIGVGSFPSLFAWQQTGERRARSLSNLRRLADAWQLYAQDWDACPVPPVEHRPDGTWLTWPSRLGAYGVTSALLDNPANPASARAHPLHDPTRGFAVPTSYAINRRFWNTFSAGPFPVDNLELPAQTALFVEAGPMSASVSRAPKNEAESKGLGILEYGDTLDRVGALVPYPATHDGKMAVVAADGHAPTLHIEHYTKENGPHNSLYGRIGGDLYNWNGGHANGETDRPPQE